MPEICALPPFSFRFNFSLPETQIFAGTFILDEAGTSKMRERQRGWKRRGEERRKGGREKESWRRVALVYSRGNKADFVPANAITRAGGRAESH